jgi:hypothetical protein
VKHSLLYQIIAFATTTDRFASFPNLKHEEIGENVQHAGDTANTIPSLFLSRRRKRNTKLFDRKLAYQDRYILTERFTDSSRRFRHAKPRSESEWWYRAILDSLQKLSSRLIDRRFLEELLVVVSELSRR